jgi:glutamate-1-semialdehyde 2,1-aminomutase
MSEPDQSYKRALAGESGLLVLKGSGSRILDEDGKEYIDYFLSDGTVILGYSHPETLDAIRSAMEAGIALAGPLRAEVELADLLQEAAGEGCSARLVNSGTEAVINAILLSRMFTGREGVLLIGGGTHGHMGSFFESGSLQTPPRRDPRGGARDSRPPVLKVPFNEITELQEIVEAYEDSFACILMEPILTRDGLILPGEGYLETVKDVAGEYGILLIFDEVYTGFRVVYGGASGFYDVSPDLTCFGPTLGGGLPIGAFCGRREIMELLCPSGPVFQAGNPAGRTLACIAGIRTLRALREAGSYGRLEEATGRLVGGLRRAASETGSGLTVSSVGSMVGLCFGHPGEPPRAGERRRCDAMRYGRFFHGMLDRGIFLPPFYGATSFLSLAHTREEIDRTVHAAREVLAAIA